MKSPKFIATTVAPTMRLGWLRHATPEALDRFMGKQGFEDSVVAASPLRSADFAMLFTYMHRRFGPGHVGADDYKDIGAYWLLTTPLPDLFVFVKPTVGNIGESFLPMYAGSVSVGSEMVGDRLKKMLEAYERTLLDLLRPVCERDVQFNVLGEIKSDSADYGFKGESPAYHPSSGTPMPRGLFGGSDWHRLMTIFGGLADKDHAAGLGRFLGGLEDDAFRQIEAAHHRARPLFAAGVSVSNVEGKERLIERLKLTPRQVEHMKAFIRGGRTLGDDPLPSSLLTQKDDVAAAARCLDVMGLDGSYVRKTAGRIAEERRFRKEWAAMVAASGGMFEDSAFPKEFRKLDDVAVGEIVARLVEMGQTGMVEWAEDLRSEDGGSAILVRVFEALILQICHENAVGSASDA